MVNEWQFASGLQDATHCGFGYWSAVETRTYPIRIYLLPIRISMGSKGLWRKLYVISDGAARMAGMVEPIPA
jgi:hypothetical protein